MNKELKKIVVLGPIYPYRGGIAQYGGLLVKALEKKYDVRAISFSMMYPKWLYPGKSQKDYSAKIDIKSPINYMLNSINPISYYKTAQYINEYNPDLVIIHWWHPYFTFSDIGIMKFLKKEIKVCICCHNVLPHDSIPFSKFFSKQVLKRADMFTVHAIKEEELLVELLQKDICRTKFPCPDVSTFVRNNISRKEARKKLGLKDSDKVILFFGFVRKYKGLYHLFNIMPELKERLPEIKLLVVGEFFKEKKAYFDKIEENKLSEHIKIYDEFIPDSDVELYFAASDVVVLPYDSATGSGVIQAAYFFGKPVIVTDVGGLKEAITEGKTGYSVNPFDEKALCNSICDFFENKNTLNYEQYIEEEKYKYSWENVVDSIQDMWDRYQEQ